MLLITLIFLALTLLTLGYTFKRPALAFGSGATWFLVSIQAWISSTAEWDMYYGIFVFGIIMFLVSIIEGWALRPKKEEEPSELADSEKETKDYIERRDSFKDRMATMSGDRPRRKRRFLRSKSRVGDIDEDTGEIYGK